ncbi:MAG: glycoside hydrolase family 127 protein, partial [Chloroflexi bacterium]|nr:glycoside hydrolase family 127 protein [Chloroflexota bacterium]
SFFVDERGRQPHYFDLEARARSEVPDAYRWRPYDYCQAHLPVREQSTAEGHAVRAMYLYSGMADVAAETGDESLLAACRRLWRNVTERRMYATGGVGSSAHGERFTYDYDLPNDLAYAETCAAIGLVFWAHRMLQFEGDAAYADVMERALYNGVLSGVSLDGRQFFYGNPLEVDPTRHAQRPDLFRAPAVSAVRQEWFGCACCPPNIARLLASLGQYVYSQSESAAFVHLYVGGSAELSIGGKPIRLSQETRYPWEGRVSVAVQPERELALALCLRIPEWARGDLSRVSLTVNGEAVDVGGVLERGYARISRAWRPGETVVLDLPMSVQRVRAHPAVRANAGRVALQRGPLVYCLEEADNGPNLQAIALPRDAELRAAWEGDPLGGVVTITGEALRSDEAAWNGELYTPNDPKAKRVSIKAVPYYAWANRTPGEMLVWLRETG